MRIFIKTRIAFIYILLALFIQPSNVYASENFTKNTSQQYFVSSSKHKAALINNKKEEYYTIFQNRNRLEITNQSNKNDNSGVGNFDKVFIDYNILNSFKADNKIYPIYISYNTAQNLKNTIYTRAP